MGAMTLAELAEDAVRKDEAEKERHNQHRMSTVWDAVLRWFDISTHVKVPFEATGVEVTGMVSVVSYVVGDGTLVAHYDAFTQRITQVIYNGSEVVDLVSLGKLLEG
jgi:hypothetical protein